MKLKITNFADLDYTITGLKANLNGINDVDVITLIKNGFNNNGLFIFKKIIKR